MLRGRIILPFAPFLVFGLRGIPAGQGSPISAHDLVNEAIKVTGHKLDLRQLHSVQMSTSMLIRDIVEGEHTGEPYIVSMKTTTVTDDLQNRARLTESSTEGTDGQAPVVTRELTQVDAVQIQVSQDGKVLRSSARLSSPAWEVPSNIRGGIS